MKQLKKLQKVQATNSFAKLNELKQNQKRQQEIDIAVLDAIETILESTERAAFLTIKEVADINDSELTESLERISKSNMGLREFKLKTAPKPFNRAFILERI